VRVKLVHIPDDHTIDEDGLQRTVVWSDVVTFSVLHPDSDEGAVAEEEETAATAAHRSIPGGVGDMPLAEAEERGGGSRGGVGFMCGGGVGGGGVGVGGGVHMECSWNFRRTCITLSLKKTRMLHFGYPPPHSSFGFVKQSRPAPTT